MEKDTRQLQKEIRQLIESMDVRADRDDAETKAIAINKLGGDALDQLMEYARWVKAGAMEADEKRTRLRAVIFTLSIFADRLGSRVEERFRETSAMVLLFDLSDQGYNSAEKLLSHLGISPAAAIRERLLSLPLQEKHRQDREISLDEAVEEIKLSRFLQGQKGFLKDRYALGNEKGRIHELRRTGKRVFAYRTRKSA